MRGFVETYGLGFPQAVAEDGSLWNHFGVAYQPAWVFIDDDGSSTLVPNELTPDELSRTLDDLLHT
jgi:hypothetical protein